MNDEKEVKNEAERPERILKSWNIIVEAVEWTLNNSRGMTGVELRTLEKETRIFKVWFETDKLPFTGKSRINPDGPSMAPVPD